MKTNVAVSYRAESMGTIVVHDIVHEDVDEIRIDEGCVIISHNDKKEITIWPLLNILNIHKYEVHKE